MNPATHDFDTKTNNPRHMKAKFLATILTAGAMTAGSAQAALTVLIDFDDGNPDNGIHNSSIRNGGFEDGGVTQTFAETPFWSSYFAEGDDSNFTLSSDVQTGALRGLASGFSGTGTRRHPTNTIPAADWTISAGDVFTVSVDWRNGAGFTVGSHQFQVILHVVDADGNPVLDPDNGELNNGDRLLGRNDPLLTAGEYQTFTTTSNPVPADSPWIGNQIQLRLLNTGTRTSFVMIDNVYLAAIPEPTVTLLGGLGLLSLLRRRRR